MHIVIESDRPCLIRSVHKLPCYIRHVLESNGLLSTFVCDIRALIDNAGRTERNLVGASSMDRFEYNQGRVLLDLLYACQMCKDFRRKCIRIDCKGLIRIVK